MMDIMGENTNINTSNSKNSSSVSTLTQVRATESNAIQIPKISLPKSGGALNSIDEKFEVNATNSNAGFTIPLPFTPDRNDIFSSLSLSYNSSGSLDPFGLGWSVDYPIIQCETDKKNLMLSHEFIAIEKDNFRFEYLVKREIFLE